VARRQPGDGAPDDEVLLGPVLLLALALGGVFCLHASAVAAPDGRGAVAFAGCSGAGKSTLAAAFGPRRLGDDVLPVALDLEGAPVVLPRFPQLKLDPATQPGAGAPESLPLVAVLLPSRVAADAPSKVASLGQRAAAAELVRHTLAGRLFPPDLLARHMDLVTAFVRRVPVVRLEVPWGEDRLPRVTAAIDAAVSSPEALR
jgi:hypothetical protein